MSADCCSSETSSPAPTGPVKTKVAAMKPHVGPDSVQDSRISSRGGCVVGLYADDIAVPHKGSRSGNAGMIFQVPAATLPNREAKNPKIAPAEQNMRLPSRSIRRRQPLVSALFGLEVVLKPLLVNKSLWQRRSYE